MELASLSSWGSRDREGQRFSIKQQFAGAHVLLTGCTGYVGGLCLESLLRTTDVARVYVLLRDKRGQAAQQRVASLLQGPTFHLIRERSELLAKVTAVAGDLSEAGLGLSSSDADMLRGNVDILIHAAADIRLEAPIQETMHANYVGTERVLDLALQLRRLRSAVHVSTAYVNMNKPPGTTVHERIYPLMHGEVEVDGEKVTKELLSLSKIEADRRADFYTHHWGFPNTYCLGKHLAEQLVYRTHQATGLPLAILRPSLVTGVAGLPWPGYCGNWAGPSGMGAAVAIGFFPSLSAHATGPYSVWDAVPGDMVASSILATAAAVACGTSGDIARATGSGLWMGTHGGPVSGAAVVQAHVAGAPRGLASPLMVLASKGAHGRQPSLTSSFTDDTALVLLGGGSSGGSCCPRCGRSSRSINGPPDVADLSPTSLSPTSLSGVSEEGIDQMVGEDAPLLPQQQQRAAVGSGSGSAPASRAGTPSSLDDKCCACRADSGAAAAGAGAQPLLIVHATTSTTYPATIYEAYNTTVDFLRAHPSPVSILFGGSKYQPYMPPTWQPNERMLKVWRLYNWIKVAIVCFCLRLFGMRKMAQKLSVGYQQWAMNNDFKNDTQLLFASAALQQLHARLEPSERLDYLLTFGPPRPKGVKVQEGAGEEEPEHPAARLGWRQYSINCLAGIMRMLTGLNLPHKAPIPGRPGEFIEHHYLHIH